MSYAATCVFDDDTTSGQNESVKFIHTRYGYRKI